MYRGSNPTAIKSQQMLLEALNELLKEKEYKDISISELCERSTISRQTFYKLFGSKENLYIFQLEHLPYADKSEHDETTAITLEYTSRQFSYYVTANLDKLKMLLDNELSEVLYFQIYNAMSTCRQGLVNVDDEEREYAAMYVSAGLCQVLKKYIREHEDIEAEELNKLAYKIMSGDVFRR